MIFSHPFLNPIARADFFARQLSGLAVRDEAIQKNPKQVFGLIRTVFRALAFAGTNRDETIRLLLNWLRLDREVTARSYDLGIDQSLLELKAKGPVPLDRVRNEPFAEQARRDMGNSAGGR